MILGDLSAFDLMTESQLHQRSVYVDIDDTLLLHKDFSEAPRLNLELLSKLQVLRAHGVQVVLWTGQGREYANRIADQWRIRHLFDAVLAKPHVILDDKDDWFAGTHYVNVTR